MNIEIEVPDVVSAAELARRHVRRGDYVSCNQAFIDYRTPGSELKENYSIIGPGVTQNAEQVINLREPHGFNVGAAAMPHGVTNNLHLHFTAEVFLNFAGDWLLRWGVDGTDGEYVAHAGDIVSVPTWTFRGFTNVGTDDGWLFTILGFDDTGGIVWGPSVLAEAATHGLYLTVDNQVIDLSDGRTADVALIAPMGASELQRLRRWGPEDFASRVVRLEDLRWSVRPFLCSTLPGGGAQLATVIGYGLSEDRDQVPPIHNPHNFSVAWLRAEPGEGILVHRVHKAQVLNPYRGRWRVTLNTGADERTVELHPGDTLSVPTGAWRRLDVVGDEVGMLVVTTEGDGRARLEWDATVRARARTAGVVLDAAGYVAPWSVVRTSAVAD